LRRTDSRSSGGDIDEDGLEETIDLADDVDATGSVHPVPTDLTD
jgi:3-hydroxybutyrate dehydrogenase